MVERKITNPRDAEEEDKNLGIISFLYHSNKSPFVTVEINHLYLRFATLSLDRTIEAST